MKKLLALVLSLLMVASCFALTAIAAEETTEETTEENTYIDGTTAEETTEEAAPSYSNTLLVFNDDCKAWRILNTPNGVNKTFFKSDWEGARVLITEPGDPYFYIQYSQYLKKAGLEKLDSQSYPFVVFKLKVEGYVDDVELFFCAGTVTGADPAYATVTDYPCDGTGEIEYIIYDLTGDCEGDYNNFRFDPMGADEETIIYLYEMAFFATEEEALAYAGYDEEEDTTPEETEEDTTPEETEAPTQEIQTAPPASTEPEKSCGSVIGVSTLVAIITLGAVCIKKKD